MLEKYCDILVIGTDLPGLISAAFLARRGLSVQVLDVDPYSKCAYQPDPVCLMNIKSKLLRSILGRLNVPENTIQNFLSRESNLQVLFPNHRIDIFENPLFYEEEIDREFPEFHDTLKTFYENLARIRHQTDVNDLFHHLIPQSWKEKAAFKKFIHEHHLNDRSEHFEELQNSNELLRVYLQSQFALAYHTFCQNPFAHQVAELFNPSDGAIFSVLSGQKDLQKILIDRITAHDGFIRQHHIPAKFLLRQGIVEGVEIEGSQDKVFAKYTIWNDSLTRLGEILPNKWKFRHLKKCGQLYPSYQHWFTARFQVDKKFVPDPLKENAILIMDPHAELRSANYLYLQTNTQENSSKTTIDAHFLLPKSALKESSEFFEPIFQDIHQALVKMMPFSDKSLKQIFPVQEDDAEDDLFFPLQQENNFDVFLYSAEQHGIAEQQEKSFGDLLPLNYKTNCPNFFIAQSDVFRAFGLDSKLTLGLKITDQIWQETEKEKKRAMKSERRIA